MTPIPADMRVAANMSETELQSMVRKLCNRRGLIVQHDPDSTLAWEQGWPDLEIVGRRGIIYRELKIEHGRCSAEQWEVGRLIADGGGDWAVWFPSHLLDGTIERELDAIAKVRT